ncbi:Putative TPR domain protein [[Torrubiella] hemipterigena]|uniref:Putative TPR domain protein n=1 Tax=[Torrubiella] hemipterigena TaxID=1531966 RepID=A0A0A1TLD4_9HYPO|nr:Putative TPR domain protein [[Torrubiella] hemipterigena]
MAELKHVEDYLYNLGSYSRTITTTSKQAQAWFDKGLIWCYGFHHEEAVVCFENAIAHDPECAMAFWGLAYALGPNYNKGWGLFEQGEMQTAAERTHEAVEQAKKKSAGATEVEKVIINALQKRYPQGQAPKEQEWPIWNTEYADAMEKVASEFPADLDIGALYADAMMNLTPWELWDIYTGKPTEKARTMEIKRVLDHGIAQPGGKQHPGLLHLYIHMVEMSRNPEDGMPAANLLRGLVPDSGHLNHMPSHLDVLTGDYASGVKANTDAMIADEKFLADKGPLNFYTLYRSHDYHFRLYCAMFSGQSKIALETVDKLNASITEEALRVQTPPMADWLEAFLAMRVHALIRFGLWQEIIDIPLAKDQELYCVGTALLHYAKGMAFAALGKVPEAQAERDLFSVTRKLVKESRTIFNNKCVDILTVADAMLDGEIAYRSGDFSAAFEHLRESIRRYDTLPFDEPWGWMQPARHAYGALLLEQGHVEEARVVYEQDLGLDEILPRIHQHPNNVWALHGYHECLVRLGQQDLAAEIRPKLDAALAVADVPISSSCFCRKKCHVA